MACKIIGREKCTTLLNEKLKPFEYYRENKKKFNRKYNQQWKMISYPEYVGMCSYLFQDFIKVWKDKHKEQPTYEDFFRYYLSHVNTESNSNGIKKPDCVNYGRTLDDLIKLANFYKDSCGDDSISLESCFDDIVNHVIIETFNGQMREIKLKNAYTSKGFSVERTNGKWDKDYGVDMVIRNKDGVICEYIQVKPLSAFLGKYNHSLMEDRRMFFRKEEAKKTACERTNYPYYPTKFVLYNEDYPDKWCSLRGKKGFYLNELCDTDGNPKHQFHEFSYIN